MPLLLFLASDYAKMNNKIMAYENDICTRKIFNERTNLANIHRYVLWLKRRVKCKLKKAKITS